RNNLLSAFPEKTPQERKIIEKKSFHHFVDIFMEMIKSFTISEKEISKRFIYKNTDILNDLYKQNKSLIIMAGHYANWEWVVNVSGIVPYKGYAAYKKVKNKYFENKVKTSRTRFGANFIPTSEFMNIMTIHKEEHVLALYGLLSDQSPKLSKTHYWSDFMGVNVPVHTGAEMLSKKYNYPVIYFKTERIKRGYYESTVEVLAKNPQDFKNYEITDIFLQKLENQIRNNPEYYFWTHKRFKHMKSK
ncbi:MAG: lysophospholipid acyltransferase family protein, partial [Flavobacteriaceae bacterium]|nr:lysophospholipid acyltransferase family protein [Flavobacteriaceae bacterium]